MNGLLQRACRGAIVAVALIPEPSSAQTAAQAVPASELLFTPIAPCRAFSTNVQASTSKNLVVVGTTGFPAQGGASAGCGVPAAATAVSISLTALNAAGVGTLTASAAGAPTPVPATALSFTTGQASTATSIVSIKSKRIALAAVGHSTQVNGDITGYFVPPIAGLLGGDGTLQSATPRVVSASRTGPGSYTVTVDRDVRACSIQASTYNLGRYSSVGLSSSSTPQVFSIFVWSLSSTAQAVLTDYSVFFHVVC